MNKFTFSTLIVLAGVLFVTGCKQKENATLQTEAVVTPTVNQNHAKLQEILENPGAFNGKEVVLEGNFGGACCETDFFYKEGLNSCEVYPQGFANPKVALGAPIRIIGTVKATQKKTETGEENYLVNIEATKVEKR